MFKLAKVIEQGYEKRVLMRVPHLVLLDPGFYEHVMKPVMTELTETWMSTQHFDPAILGGVPLREALADKHLVSEPALSLERSLSPLTLKRELSVGKLSEVEGPMAKHFKMLNMCHDWLQSFLPHALLKIDRVTFGIMSQADRERALQSDPFMPRSRWKLGIPFVSKDVPSSSSEFAHPYVLNIYKIFFVFIQIKILYKNKI